VRESRGDEPVPLRDALNRVGAELGMPAPDAIGAVHARWEEIVGPDVARHARPSGVRDGVLTVVVDDPAWATQLRFLEAEIVRAAAAVAGPEIVREVRVRVGSV
jgi:predicted nucleic acid-binding Zn ribbon protein